MEALLETSISEIPLLHKGKVRDIYDLDDKLLIIATDRISAFDCVFPNGIPGKGKVLTAISNKWFKLMDFIDNHIIATDVKDFPEVLKPHSAMLDGRAVIVKKAKRIDFECVVRGYITGSGWKEYQETGTLCGETLMPGLVEAEKLAMPRFTPSTKADNGHDENISLAVMIAALGKNLSEDLRKKSLQLYEKAQSMMVKHGILLADTKFEFGLLGDKVILIDELLTPDSSRFWPASLYSPGKTPPGFDKQYVRDYVSSTGWDKEPPAPVLPDDVVEKTMEKYQEILQIIEKI